MVIDLETRSVRFVAGETLTLDQLYSLIDLMDDGEYDEPEDECCDGAHPEWVVVERVVLVRSETSMKQYAVVRFDDGTWACSCPDWTCRRAYRGENCKHIHTAIWSFR